MGRLRGLLLWLWIRLRRLPRSLRIAGAIGVPVVVGGVLYSGGQVYNYTQNDPNFCRSCHTMEKAWTRWQTSEHKEVNCHYCHEVSPIGGAELVVSYMINRPDKPGEHAYVSDEKCKKCHESGDVKWVQVLDTAGHRIHAEEQDIPCTKCHSVSLHRFTPPEKVCGVCHGEKEMKVSQMGQLHCTSCHDYLRPDGELRPEREPCLSCHAAQGRTDITWPANAPMQFKCSDCHQPHEQEKPVVDCNTCHSQVKQQGLHQKNTHSVVACQTCHRPHEWTVSKRENCTTCHGNKARHNANVSCVNCHDFKKKA